MLTGDQIRVPYEKEALIKTLAVILIIIFLFAGLSLGLILLPIIYAIFYIKSEQSKLLGNSIKIDKKQFPKIYKLCEKASKNLSMDMPDVFIRQDPILNAYAIGTWGTGNFVILHSSLIEAMTEQELLQVIGHEFTHIKCEHTRWLTFTNLKDSINIPIISDLLGLIFNSWSRKVEYTSDRGGLIANQNVKASITSLAKLAVGKELFSQLDLDVFKHQKEEINKDGILELNELLQSHPYVVNRIQHLLKFDQSKKYKRLLSQL